MRTIKLIITSISIFVLAEIAAQTSSITDVPLYDSDNNIGYIPKAKQQGVFLKKYRWRFNELHMMNEEFRPSDENDILLIGDSIVLGSADVDISDRVGESLEKSTKSQVWAVGAGSWALVNELRYLKRFKKELIGIDKYVFILNSADFMQPSSWSCESTHPRTSPLIATAYLAKKSIKALDNCGEYSKENIVFSDGYESEYEDFIGSIEFDGKDVEIFMYPTKNELENNSLMIEFNQHIERLQNLSNGNVKFFDISKDKRWNADCYKDRIHPKNECNKILAEIIKNPDINAAPKKNSTL